MEAKQFRGARLRRRIGRVCFQSPDRENMGKEIPIQVPWGHSAVAWKAYSNYDVWAFLIRIPVIMPAATLLTYRRLQQVQIPFPETLLALLILVAHKSRLEKAKPSLHGLFSMTRQLTAQVLTSSSCLCFRWRYVGHICLFLPFFFNTLIEFHASTT